MKPYARLSDALFVTLIDKWRDFLIAKWRGFGGVNSVGSFEN
jgi:hypothetical protein